MNEHQNIGINQAYRIETFPLYDIKRRLTKERGRIDNNYSMHNPTLDFEKDVECQEIILNAIDNVPFKPIVAKVLPNGTMMIDSKVVQVLLAAMDGISVHASIPLDKADPNRPVINEDNYPIGHFEDLKLTFYCIFHSIPNMLDESRICKY